MVEHVQRQLAVSERRACRAIGQSRSSQRYEPLEDEEEKRLIAEMLVLVGKHPRFGYRRICVLLRRDGWKVNRKTHLSPVGSGRAESATKAAEKAAIGL